MSATLSDSPGAAQPPDDGADVPPPSDDAGGPPFEPTDALMTRAPRERRRSGLWARLGIQSKLLTMLLLTSILSALVVGWFGYRSGSDSLRQEALDQVVAIRDARTAAIRTQFTSLERSLILNSSNATATQAVTELTRDFQQLQDRPVTAAERASVTAYYRDVFLPQLRANAPGEVSANALLPTDNAQWYLQSRYTAPYATFEEAVRQDNAGDGSQWSADHAKYHPFFREVTQRYGFEDVMLLDTEGNVVYTAYKGVDLGANILTGASYRDSSLAEAYQKVLRANVVNAFSLTDFEPYQPSGDVPTAFGFSPVGVDGRLIGVLAVQLPNAAISATMTNGQDWSAAGLGDSGESYLVGPDRTLRSTSRLLLDDPPAYRRDTVDNGTAPELADQIVASGNPVLRQSVDSTSVTRALQGRSGTTTETDYLGRRVIAAYAPAGIPGLNWAVVAQVDEDEALAPVSDFLRSVALSVLALVLLVTLASLLLAQAFSRPVARLVEGVRSVAAGNLDTRVSMRNRDEFAQLADAFNDMAASLRTKQDLLDAQMEENDRMLLALMPQPVAERFRGGEQNIADEHVDVSTIFAAVDGFDEFTLGKSPEESLALLNDLFGRFERVAEQSGVERVRTLRSGFVACCGLTVPRVDHATRMVDFARQMQETTVRFNGQYGAHLSLRAGIDSGSVTAGLVGGSSLFDLWGDSVNVAFSVQAATSEPGIYLSRNVHERVRDSYPTRQVGTVTVKGAAEPVWRLEDDQSDAGTSRG